MTLFTIGDYAVISADTETLTGAWITGYTVRQISTETIIGSVTLYATALSRACKLAGQIGA